MRFIRRHIFRPIIILLLIIIPVVMFGKAGFSFTFTPSKTDYSNVLRDGVVDGSSRIVDIAMLGAHDAFSDKITTNSPIDPAEPEDSLLRNQTLGKVADGVFVRLSRAQKSNAETLLKAGVRYFDVRISYYENEWYTKHGLISDKLSRYLSDIITFLSDNPGEFIIFDIQHVHFGDTVGFSELFDYLQTYQISNVAITDFINYDPLSLQPRDLTYDIVTDTGAKAGLVILAKTPASASLPYHYNRGNGDTQVINIRSLWHNTADTDTLIEGIQTEYEYLSDTVIYEDIFRVNQAQKTGVLSGDDLWDTVFGWSLLDMANNSNAALIAHEDFLDWLTKMPILMVDYADSTKGDFNKVANDAMIAYNNAL